MSGGSHNYAYAGVYNMVDSLANYSQTPLRIAFAEHLGHVAAAMKAVEWVDSGDCSEPYAEDAIKTCLYSAQAIIKQLAVNRIRTKNQEWPDTHTEF